MLVFAICGIVSSDLPSADGFSSRWQYLHQENIITAAAQTACFTHGRVGLDQLLMPWFSCNV